MLKHVKHLVFAVGVMSLFAINIFAQTPARVQAPDVSELWLTLNDHAGTIQTVTYGNGLLATYCLDNGDSGSTNYWESIAPPPPPDGWDMRWKGVRTTAGNACIVDGLFPRDYRALPAPGNTAKRDTFALFFGNTTVPDSSVTINWPDATYLAARCDSMFMKYTDPCSGTPTVVNMFTQNTLDIPSAYGGCGNTGSLLKVNIYKFGCAIVDGVNDKPAPKRIDEFALKSNYPNPFNPSTNITFDISKNSAVDVSIYNVLGQKIATLVTGQLTQGEHTTVWNGTTPNGAPVSSGVYFVRMNARVEGTGEVFTALRKLLLMK